ncbi:ATP-citrate synthase [Trachymyrmex septentrionalis]|uniref:ATP-citrate synthase n=1 Tax=Trachymyrmex septentrionalis TaxID=34720 RepID=A0A151K3I5_9HYME|nr:ATP-citrate synthase [Trachymyrmex septentrionalis]
MAAKAIREATGKNLINRKLSVGTKAAKCRFVSITENTNWIDIVNEHSWLKTERLVVKPDQLIKRRGKLGLIKVNADLIAVQKWIEQHMNKEQRIGKAIGKLKTFIIEPFVPHKSVRFFLHYCLVLYTVLKTVLKQS